MAAWRIGKRQKKESPAGAGTGQQNPPIPKFADAVAAVTSGTGDQEKAFENLVAATTQAGRSLSELAKQNKLAVEAAEQNRLKELRKELRKAMMSLPPVPTTLPPKPPVSIVQMFYVDEDDIYQGERQILLHAESQCIGRKSPCCVHSPSDNHMNEWPMLWNKLKRIMFRKCEHGVWHPDFDHLAHAEMRWGYEKAEAEAVHTCDGCCERIFF